MPPPKIEKAVAALVSRPISLSFTASFDFSRICQFWLIPKFPRSMGPQATGFLAHPSGHEVFGG